MLLYKIVAIALITHGISVMPVTAQNAVGRITYLMHPSGIPASVTTNENGTISNVDGRIVGETEETGLGAHQSAVKELRWSGFQLQETIPQGSQ
jgi:hypothetical protein